MVRTKAVIAGDLLSVFNVDSPKTTAALQLGEIYVTLAIEVILAVLIGLGLVAIGLDGATWISGGIAFMGQQRCEELSFSYLFH